MSDPGVGAFLDTSFVVRYLTNDPPEMADLAAEVIDADEPLLLSEMVLVETAYVLESVYEVARAPLVDTLAAFVQRRNLRPLRLTKPLILEALGLCRGSNRVSFTDAMLWAQARHEGAQRIYSFDRRFPSRGLQIVDAP